MVNCSGHTFPVEKFLLEEDWLRVVPGGAIDTPPPLSKEAAKPATEDILGALDQLDSRVQHIVIVEDNPDAARLLRRILQTRRDFQVSEAYTGKEGLDLIRKSPPDLILLDLMMPDMDGFAMLDHLKTEARLQDIPVIVITAKELTQEERQHLQGQIKMLLQKGSFMDGDLVEEIDALLGKERSEQT